MSRDVRSRIRPEHALVVAVLAVGTSAILIRWSDAPSAVKALYRVSLSLAILVPLSRFRHPGAVGQLARRDLFVAGGAGAALSAHFAAWFESLAWTSVAASVTLVQTQPLFVAVGAWALLDERVTRETVGGIGLAVCGAAVMAAAAPTGTELWPLYGNALAVTGALAGAGYVLAGRALRQRIPLLPYVTVVYGTCAVGLLAVVLARHGPDALVGYPPHEWLLFAAMAVGPGVFGHTVLNWTLEHVESSVVAVSLVGEPVVSTLLAFVLLGERPADVVIVGGVAVLLGIVVTARARRTVDPQSR